MKGLGYMLIYELVVYERIVQGHTSAVIPCPKTRKALAAEVFKPLSAILCLID
jgi:hypothetical protein